MTNVEWFKDIGIDDVPHVGGKNASLGEMYRELDDKGVRVPNGFATTADAFREFLTVNELDTEIDELLAGWDREDVDDLYEELTAAGHAGQQPPYDAFWGARYAIVLDPSGNAVGLMSPVDPARRGRPPTPPA